MIFEAPKHEHKESVMPVILSEAKDLGFIALEITE
jgi:hypothetical protein